MHLLEETVKWNAAHLAAESRRQQETPASTDKEVFPNFTAALHAALVDVATKTATDVAEWGLLGVVDNYDPGQTIAFYRGWGVPGPLIALVDIENDGEWVYFPNRMVIAADSAGDYACTFRPIQ